MRPIAASIVLSFLTFAGSSSAQQAGGTPENTAGACRDGLDNDGDGYSDCTDQDCQLFTFCVGAGSPAPMPLGGRPGDPEAPWYLMRGRQPPPPPTGYGWARGAGISGFVLTGLSLLATVITPSLGSRSQVAGIVIGATQTVLLGAGAPIVAAGSASARREGGVRAARRTRIAAWIIYGFAMLMNIAGLAVQDDPTIESADGASTSENWSILLSGGVLSVTTLALMSIDAMVADRDANRRLEFYAAE